MGTTESKVVREHCDKFMEAILPLDDKAQLDSINGLISELEAAAEAKEEELDDEGEEEEEDDFDDDEDAGDYDDDDDDFEGDESFEED